VVPSGVRLDREAQVTFADNFKQSTHLGYLAILRIVLGCQFFYLGWEKVSGEFIHGQLLPAQLMRGVAKDPFAWHRAFIDGFVLPHSTFFTYLVAFGELAIGTSLILACLVRVSSSFGAFHNLNIFLAIALASGGAQLRLNLTFIFLHLVFVFASAGRSLGLDGILHRKFPRRRLF
jgi:uncharacterized membrane protein YphA (DoxX/SURF4 family)